MGSAFCDDATLLFFLSCITLNASFVKTSLLWPFEEIVEMIVTCNAHVSIKPQREVLKVCKYCINVQ